MFCCKICFVIQCPEIFKQKYKTQLRAPSAAESADSRHIHPAKHNEPNVHVIHEHGDVAAEDNEGEAELHPRLWGDSSDHIFYASDLLAGNEAEALVDHPLEENHHSVEQSQSGTASQPSQSVNGIARSSSGGPSNLSHSQQLSQSGTGSMSGSVASKSSYSWTEAGSEVRFTRCAYHDLHLSI